MKCFVIMPFEKALDNVYTMVIKPAASEAGITVYRLDEELFDEGMLEKIYANIKDCDFIIADLSHKNPNVFYELGFAHALEKLTLLLTDNVDNIPFDLKHKRHIVYNDSLLDLRLELDKNIKWAIQEMTLRTKNSFSVSLATSGELELSEYYAEADISFKIDITNMANHLSEEIHSISLHTMQKWEVSILGRLLPYHTSEQERFVYQYQFKPEIVKIAQNGWSQVELRLQRRIASKLNGDEIKSNYTVNGEVLVQLITAKKVEPFEFSLSQTINALTF